MLIVHDREPEAARIVDEFERRVVEVGGSLSDISSIRRLKMSQSYHLTLAEVAGVLLHRYPTRVVLGLVLMRPRHSSTTQFSLPMASCSPASKASAPNAVGWFILPFALGNFWVRFCWVRSSTRSAGSPCRGDLCAGGRADHCSRISFSGRGPRCGQQTLGWTVTFFFASAAASGAYLTVGESFPLEMRGACHRALYAAGTAIGGIAAPALLGALIETGSRSEVLLGYLLGGALMLVAA